MCKIPTTEGSCRDKLCFFLAHDMMHHGPACGRRDLACRTMAGFSFSTELTRVVTNDGGIAGDFDGGLELYILMRGKVWLR